MNFDFLKDLDVLKKVYKYCGDAEKCAVTTPYISMFITRKSAETLAKLIYYKVYRINKVNNLSFVDILSDDKIKTYINNKSVINAFHAIRKSGNNAVHGENEINAEQSVELLKKLHYVVGQIAIKLNLIKSYSPLNTKCLNEVELTEDELKGYIAEDHFNNILRQYNFYCKPFRFINGDLYLHESIEFKQRQIPSYVIPQLQEYFGTFVLYAVKYQRKETDRELVFTPTLEIYGKDHFISRNIFEFMNGLSKKLPFAEHFKIDIYYEGEDFDFIYDTVADTSSDISIIYKKLEALVYNLPNAEGVIYKNSFFYYNNGEGGVSLLQNGKKCSLTERCTPDIINKHFDIWWCCDISIYIEFEFTKHSDILNELHNIVRKYLLYDELKYCEEYLKDGENNILVDGIVWLTECLREVQNFLNEVNEIILPIKNECKCGAEGTWYITDEAFAVAYIDWFEDGFKVVGTEF